MSTVAATATGLAVHLPALQVVVPLVAAPLAIFLRPPALAWGLATVVSLVATVIAALLLATVVESGTISYAVGNWEPPFGIEYRIDVLSALMMLLVSTVAAVVLIWGRQSVEKEIDRDRIYLFYVAYLLCLTGLLGMLATGDAFNLFVFLEISSLSSYALISQARDRRALRAAYNYLVMGTIGATFYVIGIGLMYMITGTLNMADMARIVAEGPVAHRTLLVAMAFIGVGLSLKIALFPLHAWLPGAYAYAPSVVSAFLAATATKVGLYVLIRMLFTVFGETVVHAEVVEEVALLVLGLGAMFAGSLVAVFRKNVKKLLAWSSVAQVGYMTVGVGMLTVPGLTAGLTHVLNHALIKGTLFMALGCVVYRLGSARIEVLHGAARVMPWTMAAFVVGGLSLIGVPATAGFVSKWYLMLAAFDAGMWWLAVAIVLSSLIAVIYVWKVVEVAYLRAPTAATARAGEAPLGMLIPLWVMVAANVWFGFDTSLTVDTARLAARSLLEGAP